MIFGHQIIKIRHLKGYISQKNHNSKIIFMQNKRSIAVLLVPNLSLPAISSSIILAFLLHIHGEPFLRNTLYIYVLNSSIIFLRAWQHAFGFRKQDKISKYVRKRTKRHYSSRRTHLHIHSSKKGLMLTFLW